ncbi:MAG: hypothetical protein JSW47_09590 [Phycisphaerales bacterium]|nr:MAG: hypothetical protein JSW47_09590 [Phycisphaerales bacterium]
MATQLAQIAIELVRLIPSILWFLLVILLLVLFYRPIRDELLPNTVPLQSATGQYENARAVI